MKQGRAEAYYRAEHAEERIVLTPDDVDSFIDALLAGTDSENMAELHSLDRPLLASGFPDHEFLVGVDRELQVGVLSFMDETGNLVSLGDGKGRGGVSYFIVGNGTEFPDRSEIPVILVRQAVKEFLNSGGQRPTCVQWQEPDIW
ncbi:Imm1 family immunity protein [Streptomyces sp. AC550_RSS872]|uniref:Imm1 family immunity protein n=1 Tax=Streptomyces sp. AC550_RSS872 TaxID=2823689 RepID=UPI001C279E34|nr:Imm1 family immunity protein [Streptomyces sp. AC550_RSS872]